MTIHLGVLELSVPFYQGQSEGKISEVQNDNHTKCFEIILWIEPLHGATAHQNFFLFHDTAD